MQATASTKRFGFNRFNGSVAAVGIAVAFAAGIVTGIAGQSVLDDSTGAADSPAAVVRPNANVSAGQHSVGEAVLPEEAVDAQLRSERPRAYWQPNLGEGLISGQYDAATLRTPVVPYDVMRELELNRVLPGDTDVTLSQQDLWQFEWEREQPR